MTTTTNDSERRVTAMAGGVPRMPSIITTSQDSASDPQDQPLGAPVMICPVCGRYPAAPGFVCEWCQFDARR